MKGKSCVNLLVVCGLLLALVGSIGAQEVVSTASTKQIPQSSSVMFIENIGQFDENARFQVRDGSGIMWLTEDAVWISLVETSTTESRKPFEPERTEVDREDKPRRGVNLKLSFPGANPSPRIEPFDRLDTVVSYFIGNDPDQWYPDVPVWGGVRYVGLYPGVDLEITSQDNRWTWQVVADNEETLSQVHLQVEGADALALDDDVLHLTTAVGEFDLPLMQTVTVEGISLGLATAQPTIAGNEIHSPFAKPSVNLSSQLTTQDNPNDLLYSTFLGGSVSALTGSDYGHAIVVDIAGSAYVVGSTQSFNFPTTPGAFDTEYNGGRNAFVVKVNTGGTGLVYATFLGGSNDTEAFALVLDRTDNAYLTGYTDSSDFPTTPGAFDTSYNGEDVFGHDAFVVKLDETGSSLVYSTFLGGSGWDEGNSIVSDTSGAVYVTGRTISPDFPTTTDVFDTNHNGNDDAFIAKLNPGGTGLVYSTFLGGVRSDWGRAIAVDNLGSVYVTGETISSDFPTTPGAFDTICGTDGNCNYDYGLGHHTDIFIVKVNAEGAGLFYATFLGGSNTDIGWAIAVDGMGSVYVTGYTASSDFSTTPGAFDTILGNEMDAFVVKLNVSGTGLTYATFLGGGSHNDIGYAVVLNEIGNAYVTGVTFSSDFPITAEAFDTNLSDHGDTFVAKMNSDGTGLVYATFLGGSSFDYGYAIALGGTDNAYITGYTESSDFPTTPGAFDTSLGGYRDAFVAKLAMGRRPLTKTPVVLVHGFRGFGWKTYRCSNGIKKWYLGSELPETFENMAQWLHNDGFDVWVAGLDTGPLGTPLLENNAWGAGCLNDQINYVKQITGAKQVILVAHSMGGIVSRAYLESSAYRDQNNVQVLFTLGSPHAGIPEDWLKFLLGPHTFSTWCKSQEVLCQMVEKRMDEWNQKNGFKSQGVTPPYYLIGGDKSDSFWGQKLKTWAYPNDGRVGTHSAQALKQGSSAIGSNVRGRYQTHESHSEGCCGYPSYFQPPIDETYSQSYLCIQNQLLKMSNPCEEPSAAAMLAQEGPGLTEYTPDIRGHLDTGEVVEHSLQVDTDGASLFYLSWVTGTLGITLTNPVGTVVDPNYAAANPNVVTYTVSSGTEMTLPFASYAFTTTVPGVYTASITVGDVSETGTDYLLFTAMETPRTLMVVLDSNHYQIGDIAVLTATLQGIEGGITGATVQATFTRSDAITDTMTLSDQGDGTYSGVYVVPNAPGYLHLRVTAQGEDVEETFSRQIDRLLTVASPIVQLTGNYTDYTENTDGNGRYEVLVVDVEVLTVGIGEFTFSANLVTEDEQFIAHTITQTVFATGTQTVPLRFDGQLIHDGDRDGPFTMTNLIISDLQNAGIPCVTADDVWTTAVYDHTKFGRITGDMNGDCIVTVVDIMLVASRWGTHIGDIRYEGFYDLDNSGSIDVADIMFVAARWREKC